MPEPLSIDETLKNLKLQAQKTLAKVLQDNQDRWEQEIQKKQQHILEKIDPNHIKLNIGGKKFVTSRSVLTNLKGTKLDKMITGKYPIMLDEKGRIFVDRNGEYFGHVLDCLRSGKVEYPTDSEISRRVKLEYEYFGLIEASEKPKKVIDEEVKKDSNNDNQKLGLDNLFVEEGFEWKLKLPSEVNGASCNGKSFSSEKLCHVIGTKVLEEGVYKWKFSVEEFGGSESLNREVIFGITHTDTEKAIQDVSGCIGFSTVGDVFLGCSFKNGKDGEPQADGASGIPALQLDNQEITLTLDLNVKTLQVKLKNSSEDHILVLHNIEKNSFYPCFYVENAKVTLLEARKITDETKETEDEELQKAIYMSMME